MNTPTDEQVKSYIKSVPGLRQTWGIPKAKNMGTVALALMSLLLMGVTVGTVAYFMRVDTSISFKHADGLLIVLALAYAVSALRVFQLRAERNELPGFRKLLAQRLTGNPETDGEAQMQAETDYKWESIRYQRIARMIGLAALIIIAINTYQVGTNDFARVLIFDGAILIYLTGAFWCNFAFKAELLEVELEERSRATIKWQTEHPGEAQAEEQEADDAPARPAATGAHSKDEGSDDPHGKDGDSGIAL